MTAKLSKSPRVAIAVQAFVLFLVRPLVLLTLQICQSVVCWLLLRLRHLLQNRVVAVYTKCNSVMFCAIR